MNDDDLARRYREASAELDERPAASARASILAAAAREVGAGPADAAKYRRRWPLAAAAAIMLSTLAVMLAIRTEDEMPQFSAPPAPARSAVEEVAPAAPPAPPTADSTQRGQAAMEERKSPVPVKRPEPRTRSESDAAAQKPREANRAAPPAATAPADAPVPASPMPLPKTNAAIDEAATGAADRARSMEQAGAEARRDAARAESPASARAAQGELDATAWLERIIKLRREGRHDEADVELKRFRERHPQVQLPAEVLPATGTR